MTDCLRFQRKMISVDTIKDVQLWQLTIVSTHAIRTTT